MKAAGLTKAVAQHSDFFEDVRRGGVCFVDTEHPMFPIVGASFRKRSMRGRSTLRRGVVPTPKASSVSRRKPFTSTAGLRSTNAQRARKRGRGGQTTDEPRLASSGLSRDQNGACSPFEHAPQACPRGRTTGQDVSVPESLWVRLDHRPRGVNSTIHRHTLPSVDCRPEKSPSRLPAAGRPSASPRPNLSVAAFLRLDPEPRGVAEVVTSIEVW